MLRALLHESPYMTDTVQMNRDAAAFPDSHDAIVAADEVASFEASGWKVVDPLDHDEDGKKGGSKPDGDGVGYSAMTVVELKALATDRSLDLGDAKKKDDIIAALELADEAAVAAAIEPAPAA